MIKITTPFTIKSVFTSSSSVEIISEEGQSLVIEIDGDCCSSSYFDDNDQADLQGLIGEQLREAEDVESRISDGGDDPYYTTLYYCVKFTTDKQSISVNWRNESNGFYAGYYSTFKLS